MPGITNPEKPVTQHIETQQNPNALKRANYLQAIGREYDALAFDLDGTAYNRDGLLDPDVLNIITYNLRCHNPQIIATGRSANYTNESIVDKLPPDADVRQLFICNYNGAIVRTFDRNPDGTIKEIILKKVPCPEGQQIFDLMTTSSPWANQFVIDRETSPWQTTRPDGSTQGFASKVRECETTLVLRDPKTGPTREQIVDFITRHGFPPDKVQTTGGYIKYDFTSAAATKESAINTIADLLGIQATDIARVGDSGNFGGNDWEMLQSPSGFSVGARDEKNPDFCHAVVSSSGEILKGLDGYKQLVEDIQYKARIIVPAIAFQDSEEKQRLKEIFRSLGRDARDRFAQLSAEFEERTFQGNQVLNNQEIQRLKEQQEKIKSNFSFTGAIMVSENEINTLPQSPLSTFINTPSTTHPYRYRITYGPNKTSYCRGEAFYEVSDLVSETGSPYDMFQNICATHHDLQNRRDEIDNYVRHNRLTFAEWKVALAYYDHLKQSSIQIFHAFSFLKTMGLISTDETNSGLNETLRQYARLNSQAYFDLLEMKQPRSSEESSRQLLDYQNAEATISNVLAGLPNEKIKLAKKAIRCMEEDHPYYNYIFSMSVADRLTKQGLSSIILAGQHFGGAEFPFIIGKLLEDENPNIDIDYLSYQYSRYGMRGLKGSKHLRIESITDRQIPLAGREIVICDDGVFSGKTLYRVGLATTLKGAHVQFATAGIGTRDVGHMVEAGVIRPDFYQREFARSTIRVTPDAKTNTIEELQEARKGEENLVRRRLKNFFT